MANIRGFGNNGGNVNRNNNYQQLQPGFNQQAGGLNIPFLQQQQGSNPSEEHFGSMLINSLCPRIQPISVTVFLFVIITTLFYTMIGLGGIDQQSFLQVNFNTLKNFGANSPQDVKNSGQLYLWFTSVFLAYNFLNWVTSSFYLLIFCSSLENTVGMRNTFIIFSMGGVCGAMFGSVIQCCGLEIYSELSSGIYALVGAYLAIIVLFWQQLEGLGQVRTFLGCLIFLMIIFVLLFAFANNFLYSDNLGGLGGFLGGLFIGMALFEVPQSGEYEKNVRKFGLGFLTVFVALCIILLFSLNFN